MPNSFFTRDDAWFLPTDHCRGPWDAEACHAGPPTGLLARALELAVPKQRLTRITVDLLRPIPFAGFRVDAKVVRSGRTVSTAEAVICDRDGKSLVVARGLFMQEQPEDALPSYHESIGDPDDAIVGAFPFSDTLHGLPAFNGSGVEMRYPPDEDTRPGPTVAWMKTVPLLADEQPSPFQRICPLADCGNAFGRNAEPHEVTFLNTDLTLSLHRDPVGDWMGSKSVGFWQSNGIGAAVATLYDRHGAVGQAVQTLLLRKVQP